METFELLQTNKVIVKNNDLWIDAETIGKGLGFVEPRIAINKVYNRHKEELDNFSTVTKMTSLDGKDRFKRVFNEEGVYLITMHADTPKASQFRIELARFVKAKRLEALQEAKITGFELSNKLNNRYRNLRLTNSEISRLHVLLGAGIPKKDIAKILRVSVNSIRRIEKDLTALNISTVNN